MGRDTKAWVEGMLVRPPVMLLVLAGAALLLILLQLPISQDFSLFAFYDPGAALKADELVARGLRPTVDFAYSYGLLPLWLGRGWFALAGRTPEAYGALELMGSMVLAVGLARVGAALRWNGWSIVLFLAAMPYTILPYYLNQTHLVEAVLLVHALAWQARGRRDWALALATVGLFAKPSMAYVYGLWLVVLIVGGAACGRSARRKALRQMLPAAGVAVGLLAAFWVLEGPGILWNTLLPFNAHRSYEAADFGFFFGVGREFWLQPSVGHYLFTEAGFWLICTLGLLAAGGAVMVRGRKTGTAATIGNETVRWREMLLTFLVLHVVFVCGLYAWKNSWWYYAYLPMLALPTAVTHLLTGRWQLRAVAGLVAVALLGQGIKMKETLGAWPGKSHDSATGGLWAWVEQRGEWVDAQAMVRGERALLLTNGWIGHLAGGFDTPETWWLSPGLNTPAELETLRVKLAQADRVVRWAELGRLDPWLFPEFAEETRQFRTLWRGEFFIVMERVEKRTGTTQPRAEAATEPMAR